MNKKQPEKLFIVRKFIMARSVQEALSKEKKVKPDDCWIDEDYRKKQTEQLTPAIGFNIETDDY